MLLVYGSDGAVTPVAALSVPLWGNVTSVQAEFSAAGLGYHMLMEWTSIVCQSATSDAQACLLAGAPSERIVKLLRSCEFRKAGDS